LVTSSYSYDYNGEEDMEPLSSSMLGRIQGSLLQPLHELACFMVEATPHESEEAMVHILALYEPTISGSELLSG
jgi:hypothetical protein